MSSDYHDYFIKDGRHIGLYDEMYLYCPDPWHIEELGLRLDMRAALLLLEGREALINRFVDIGAGLGLFSSFLAEKLWRVNPEARGVISDISPQALRRASERLKDPRLDFVAADARSLAQKPLWPRASFDLVVLAQTLWGLLENLSPTLTALAELLTPQGFLLVSQHFPGPERQSYGRELVSSPEELAAHLEASGLKVLETLETNRAVNHHWAALLSRVS